MVENTEQLSKSFLRTWRYALFWVTSLFSNIGTWMQQVAEPWVVLSLSNSPFWVGLDSFALNASGLLFALFGGILADRYNKRKIVLFFQAIQFLCVLSLVALLVLGLLKVWMIVIISFLVGLTDSLSMPAFQSVIPSIVSPNDIPHAVSLNSTQFNLSRILGPAIAGIVIVRYGAVVCFSANAASYIPFFLSLYFIYPRRKRTLQSLPAQPKPKIHLVEFKKLLNNPLIRFPLMTTFVTNMFCGPLVSFCSVIIKNVFHSGAGNFGGAVTAFGIGGLIGAAITFIPFPPSFKRNRFATIVSIFLGCIVLAIAHNQSFLMLIILLIFAGAAITTTNISNNTFLHANATNDIRGRIASVNQLALSGGLSLGALLTGFTVSLFDIPTAFYINGTVCILLQALLLWRQSMQHRI